MKEQDLHNTNDTYLAQWLAGDISDEQLKEMVSEADFKAFLKLRKGINTYADLNAETDSTFAKIQEQISHKKPVKVRQLGAQRWWLGIAASVVVLLGIFFLLDNDTILVETNFGEQKTIALLDGSEVILNSKSTISYNEKNWSKNRTLQLNGEAYFKVQKGSTFTVETTNGTVQVLGTQFNVNTNLDLFEVVCYEGKVRVESKEKSVVLLPSNSLRRINGNDLEQWNVADLNPSWIHGESSFKNVPLKYVISALESQYDVTINSSKINDNIEFTGSFPHNDINIALQTVFKSLGIPYNEKEKETIYLGVK